MRVEMLKSKLYREQHAGVGMVIEMDDATAREWIAKGNCRQYAETPPLTADAAEALVPTKVARRRAIR